MSRARPLPLHLLKGRRAEDRARKYLEGQGLVFVEANYHCRIGEIDLIMREQSTVVFVEVRYRKNGDFGGALESIDFAKQRRLRNAAEHYLQRRRIGDRYPCRFDVLLITGDGAATQAGPRVEWIRDAL